MKSIGVVRNVDDLGRIVVPKEIRKKMNIKFKDPIEIFVDDDGQIILKKYSPACVFCDSLVDIIMYKDKRVCRECLENIENN